MASHAQDTAGVGTISGTVSDVTSAPLIDVRVCVKETDRCTSSDARGWFRLPELRPGTYALEIKAPSQPSFTSPPIEVRAGLEDRIDLTLPRVDAVQQSVTVSEPAFAVPEEVKSSNYVIGNREIFKSAGAQQDVSRYVQSLPGVAIGSDDFRNDIIVRGGSPLENLFVIDNIEIPNINSFANFASAGGSISLLDPALIQDTTFLTGGYPAPYINRTASVLQVTQKEGARDGFHGRATLGSAGAGGILEGPVNNGRGSWILSARRSFIDAFTDDVGFGGVPVTWSFTGKVLYDLTPRDRIWAVSVSGVDRIRLGATEDGQNDEEVNNFDIRYQGWRTAAGFNWQRLFGARGVGLLGVTHSEASVDQTVRDLVRNGVPPAGQSLDEIINNSPTIYSEDSREGETTLKYDLTVYVPALNKVQLGGSYKLFRLDYRVDSPYGNDSPYSPVPGIDPFALRQAFRSSQSGIYFQTNQNVTPRLNVTWGGRIDHYAYLGHTRFSPRAGISYRITSKLSWRASYGSYFQQPFFLFLSAFPVNRGVIPWRADHYVTGFSYVINPTFRVTLEAYQKNYKDYPVSLELPTLSLANIGDTFDVQEILFPLTSAGRGRVRGIELFMEKKFTSRWFGQANLAFSKTKHGALDGVLRDGSFDYPFIFNLVGGYRLAKTWEFSTRFSWLSGRPYTPFDASLSTGQRRGVFDLQRVNADRLPDYVRLDLRLDKTFTVRDNPLLVFAGVQNVLNRKNIAGFTWNRRLNQQQVNEQLGIFPLIGLEWRF